MTSEVIIECTDAVANISGFYYEGPSLNLEADAGEIITIIGPDYSGKSAWTKMICGMDKALSGSVKIFGKELDSYERSDWIHLRKNIAFLESDTALLSAASGLQNVMMPAMYHKIDTPLNVMIDANTLLHEITPDSDINVLPAQLRADQRYKIAIARALILRPQAIVLDSPFALLDFAAKEHLKSFLLNYSKQNNTLIIIVSHDIQFALEHSDKIIFASKNQLDTFNGKDELTSCDKSDIQEFLSSNL